MIIVKNVWSVSELEYKRLKSLKKRDLMSAIKSKVSITGMTKKVINDRYNDIYKTIKAK